MRSLNVKFQPAASKLREDTEVTEGVGEERTGARDAKIYDIL